MNKCKRKLSKYKTKIYKYNRKSPPPIVEGKLHGTCEPNQPAQHTCTSHTFCFAFISLKKYYFVNGVLYLQHITYSKVFLHSLKIPDGLNCDIRKWTNRLSFHACEDNIEHLRECGFSCGLINEVAARQVDVVTGPNSQEHSAFVNLNVWRCHYCQQGLDRNNQRSRPKNTQYSQSFFTS